MRKLVNQFSWSVSRDRLFHSCRRAYYYNYYGSWGGWEAGADQKTRQLYILKNMTSLEMWGGSIVHDVIAEALRRRALKDTPIRTGELQARAREKLRGGWKEAVAKVWLKSPKKTNLFRLYYGNGKNLPAEQTERAKKRVYGCLEAFANSPTLAEITAVSHLNWHPVDTLDSFSFDGLKLWCAIDFAYQDPAGKTRILDWKTGGEDEDSLRMQLACYAFYAADVWHVPIEQQRLMGVFLRDNARVSEYTLTPDILIETRQTIVDSAAEMRACLIDAENNAAREEDFPVADSDRPCRRCSFREACPKIEHPAIDPSAL